MKKIFTFFTAMLMTVGMFAQSYGILVNGKTYFAGSLTSEFEGFTQYLAHVPLKSGDYCQLYDKDNSTAWAVPLNASSVEGFAYDEGNKRYNVSKEGCYDFYIKLKYGADELYIGAGSGCGEGEEISGGSNPGGGGGGSTIPGNPRFMWKAELDGDWQEPRDATTFVNGECSIMFYTSCYLFLIYQVDGSAGVEYMLDAYSTDTHVRFRQGAGEKWGVPVGTTNLYLYDNGDGSVELSNQPMPGKKPWGATESIDNTFVTEKAQKVFIDGQLRIVRGDKVFDATGRQL